MKYHCYNCYKEGVYTEVEAKNRFVAEDGRVLCNKCAAGITPCSDRKRFFTDLINDKENSFYYFYKLDLFIKSKVIDIKEDEIFFENGKLAILRETEIKKVRRPSNIIGEFEWCYIIKNTDADTIGWIGKPSEK